MSLTNDQITAKNFKEFYEAIRPYLNGSFPTPIANKFDKANIYSTEEKIIGQWIDGKPVYQKTVTGTTTSAGIALITGVSDLIEAKGTVNFASQNYAYIPMTNSAEILRFMLSERSVRLLVASSTFIDKPFVATIQYTKASDSAIAIGTANDYSTTEKIVGTWVDGKPLYQKTIVKNNWQIIDGASFAHGISNVDHIFIKEADLDDNGNFVQLPLVWSTSYNGFYVNATNVVAKGTGTWGAEANRILYITLQYTKTTD